MADGTDEALTTNQGLPINDDQNSLKAGERGGTLLEDFILREKITHFDHERIPERIVHARGSGAHGVFRVYEPMAGPHERRSSCRIRRRPRPVFVRFSTVAGSRGSTDLARDVRGFAVKFYTEDGVFDLVGNNIPVFFIQDAIKFPDLVHAVKPEPHNEMPQAASAHDTFWDFISLMPESMHMIMWVMSDRAIPRSFRMMEGFGIHTFRFVNDKGKSRFVKFHWKPLLGMHSVAWDEATKISGKDPDFHRRDLWEAIENGDFPEYEFGVQIVEEKDEHAFDFDLPRPDQDHPGGGRAGAAHRPADAQPQSRTISSPRPSRWRSIPATSCRGSTSPTTRCCRAGCSPTPIRSSVAWAVPTSIRFRSTSRSRRCTTISATASISSGSIAAASPTSRTRSAAAARSRPAPTCAGSSALPSGSTRRRYAPRSRSFFDHFSQAALFFHSQSTPEQMHIVNALRFELGKVEGAGDS
jgi:catalase